MDRNQKIIMAILTTVIAGLSSILTAYFNNNSCENLIGVNKQLTTTLVQSQTDFITINNLLAEYKKNATAVTLTTTTTTDSTKTVVPIAKVLKIEKLAMKDSAVESKEIVVKDSTLENKQTVVTTFPPVKKVNKPKATIVVVRKKQTVQMTKVQNTEILDKVKVIVDRNLIKKN